MSSCGVSYTASTVGEDTGLSAYGVPADTETVNVCETWTGSDYQTQITIESSNSAEFQAADGARIIMYGAGYVDTYTGDGSYQSGTNVGASAFEFVAATPDEVQASYDAPYYGVYGGGGGSTCIQIPCEENQFSVVGTTPNDWRARPKPPGFKHNVARKGIRHLLNSFEERASDSPMRRQFHKREGATDVVLELDAATELPILEARTSATEKSVTKHVWRRGREGAWVRARTEVEAEDRLPDGRVWKQRIKITLSNVQWGRK